MGRCTRSSLGYWYTSSTTYYLTLLIPECSIRHRSSDRWRTHAIRELAVGILHQHSDRLARVRTRLRFHARATTINNSSREVARDGLVVRSVVFLSAFARSVVLSMIRGNILVIAATISM
jgi:hypothetical protein